MNRSAILATMLFIQASLVMPVFAGDFDWLDNLKFEAEADASGYKVSLSTRFHIDDVEVNAVISNVDDPSDAYMILRLGELASQPVEAVINEYRANKHKGWGVMAKNLGIQPGSSEFHALKRGHDLNNSSGKGRASKAKGKGKGI